MANPNPKLENLTNAGKGHPFLDKKRFSLYIDREVLDQINAIAKATKAKPSHVIEQLCRDSLKNNPKSN